MKNIMTQSAAAVFRDCRKKAELRYERGIVPLEDAYELYFGRIMHEALEAHHGGKPLVTSDPMVREIMNAYKLRYAQEKFTTVDLEKEFRVEIRNPATGQPNLDFVGGGKMDGIVRRSSGLWLMEHKTTSRIDAGYLERLWIDFQIAWYCVAAEEIYGEPIVGIIYNIIEKVRTEQEQGENDIEWAARLAEAKAPGRCKRKMPESDVDYHARLAEIYADPKKFHREEILLAREDLDLVRSEMWDLTQEWVNARAYKRWYRNTSHCFHWNKPCQYLPICKSRENPLLIEAQYKINAPHAELSF